MAFLLHVFITTLRRINNRYSLNLHIIDWGWLKIACIGTYVFFLSINSNNLNPKYNISYCLPIRYFYIDQN